MDDLISRQAAIDALHMHLMYRIGTDSNKKRLDDWINGVPSVQPEIIRCRDCKHRHLDGMIWNCPFGLSGGADFFCAYGAKMEVAHDSNIHAE